MKHTDLRRCVPADADQQPPLGERDSSLESERGGLTENPDRQAGTEIR